ncbi:response regulator [Lyngbya aestuarii]|uniref:response regulator n=1 Tax=Lyngbya aestuarii TaxID=118322 RepID=UPI00403DB0F1
MHSPQQTSPTLNAMQFTDSKKAQLLQTLKRLRFNGQLTLTDPNKKQWIFLLYMGHIIYATGGTHPVRRWQRHLAVHCRQMHAQTFACKSTLPGINPEDSNSCWEYQVLRLWVAQGKITHEQAANMIRAVVTEVLFDLTPAKCVTHQIKPDKSLATPMILIDVAQAVTEAQQFCQVWSNAQLAAYSPTSAPVIKQPEYLKKHTSEQVYQSLSKLLNGRNTLYDLATQTKRDIVQVTRSLLPYIESGLVELIAIPDLPTPFDAPSPDEPLTPVKSSEPLIACIDDSLLICQTMKKLLTKTGYQFVGISDPLRAIATLLACKPNLIFLDLVMPNTNGYEICTQLRKLSVFRDTPIVILTGQDGIVDQVRARLVGATDFLSKPIDAEKVLRVMNKYLEPDDVN